MLFASIPSPPTSAVELGPLTIHFYALCILAGITAAYIWGSRRWQQRGGDKDNFFDIVFAAVIAGVIGARIYHVVTVPGSYFGPGGDPISVLFIWQGGLAIVGAIMGGALAAWLMCRRKQVSFAVFADSIAPTLFLAQALGRFGNWFNQELYGGPTSVPWALEISCEQNGGIIAGCVAGTYHPTFLYEILWNLAMMVIVLVISERLQIGGGRVFWMYAMGYTAGRSWIETMRINDSSIILGQRINTLVAVLIFIIALVMFILLTRRAQRVGEAHRADDRPGSDRDLHTLEDQVR